MHNNWAVRLGVDNITNRGNYTLVNNNVDSPDFLHYYGSEPRKLVFRLRWLGKSQSLDPPTMTSSGFIVLDHPADLGIEAYGRTLAESFEQAALGPISVILDPATVKRVEAKKVELRNRHRAASG